MLYKFSVEGRDITQVRENARAVARQAFTNGRMGMKAHVIALLEIDIETQIIARPETIQCSLVSLRARCIAGHEDEVREFATRHHYDPEVLS